MIYVADIASVDVQHEQFNKSFLKLLRFTYPTEKIRFMGEVRHIENVKSDTTDADYQQIFVYSKRGGFKEFVRAYSQFKELNKIIRSIDTGDDVRFYVLLIHPFAHFLFKLFGIKGVPVTIVMHGELESLKFNKHFLNKIWGFFQKIALTVKSTNTSYIILGKSIYQNLIKVLPSFLSQKVVVLDHPYPFSDQANIDKQLSPIVFSTLGVATKAKNTHYFFQLAEAATKRGLDHRFNICGRVYKNMDGFLNNYVSYKKDFGSLTREELDKKTAESHVTVFYYENSDYSLCSSGSFWDAVNAEIPMLYVRNDYFDYYSSLVGPLGISFENPEDLNEYILNKVDKSILTGSSYKQFIANIRSLKYEYMAMDRLSRQLKGNVI
ncbi:hypothetical protein DYBT9623_02634 [Dyadobacter sp. CECT 9623]|uniref:Uncharacterized protein n=1 Tax=Dyadobacter linearis TaxID=2823330 RepID=A0ABN7RDA9_9BACT|nr:hypothetical protein [Dyadobacter sp. CECT 9623]CAG5069897.1 hypothetical protein DYBT9623_02634 [Dyadobacter sp. CECT 9623]